MKKLFLFFIALISFSAINAQTNKTKWLFGIKAGFNHTVINGFETNGNKTGFSGSTIYGSLFTEKSISETMFLGTELTFSWVNDWNLVEIPFHLRQILNKQISVFAGPKFDLAVDKLFDNTKEQNSKFFGVSAEVGAQYSFSKHVFAEGKYSFGVTRSFYDSEFDINKGLRNNFRLGIGYCF